MTRCGALYLIGETAFLYDLGENHDPGLKRWQMDLNVWCKMKYLQYVHNHHTLPGDAESSLTTEPCSWQLGMVTASQCQPPANHL